MDLVSKLVLLFWAIAALLAESYLTSGAWPAARFLNPVVCLAALLLSAIDRRTVALVAAVLVTSWRVSFRSCGLPGKAGD